MLNMSLVLMNRSLASLPASSFSRASRMLDRRCNVPSQESQPAIEASSSSASPVSGYRRPDSRAVK